MVVLQCIWSSKTKVLVILVSQLKVSCGPYFFKGSEKDHNLLYDAREK